MGSLQDVLVTLWTAATGEGSSQSKTAGAASWYLLSFTRHRVCGTIGCGRKAKVQPMIRVSSDLGDSLYLQSSLSGIQRSIAFEPFTSDKDWTVWRKVRLGLLEWYEISKLSKNQDSRFNCICP